MSSSKLDGRVHHRECRLIHAHCSAHNDLFYSGCSLLWKLSSSTPTLIPFTIVLSYTHERDRHDLLGEDLQQSRRSLSTPEAMVQPLCR